jgi:HD-like signal output (HDOD) protein
MGAPALSYTQDDIIKKLDELPSLPTIVYELTRIINDPMSSTKDVEDVMQNDMSLTARVLKLANSAYYAIPGGVSNLSRAIAYIGFDTVNQLVLSASIIDALDIKQPSGFDVNEFWRHSIGVGISAETIAKLTSHPSPPDLFTAGLIHDMGKVALCVYDVKAPALIAEHAKAKHISFAEAEESLALPKHTDIGRLLAEKWRLPSYMSPSVQHHHQPDPKLRGPLSPEQQKNVDIVYLANLVTHALKFGHSGHSRVDGSPTSLMGRLGLSETDAFVTVAKTIKANLEKAQEFIATLLGAKA